MRSRRKYIYRFSRYGEMRDRIEQREKEEYITLRAADKRNINKQKGER